MPRMPSKRSPSGAAPKSRLKKLDSVSALPEDAAAEGERASDRDLEYDPATAPVPENILWHSNAPWVGTGYGSQTALFGPLLHEQLGYRVAFSAFWGLKGSRLGWTSASGTPYVVYPAHRDGYGNDVIGTHAKHWFRGSPDNGLVILLTDPWVMNDKIINRIPTLAWTPVDHEPLMPRTRDWLAVSRAFPLAMSKFGAQQMQEGGFDTWYAPHGFNPSTFYPQDKAAAKRGLKIPEDAFLVSMVAANRGVPSRKGFSQAIPAFAEFKKKHPQAMLYLHTKMEEVDGENLHDLCAACGVRPLMTNQYAMALGCPPELVARILSASDVLLNPSHGEGFGVPLIEAQACGTPCIVTDFSSMPEVAPTKAGNWTVPGMKNWTAFDSFQRVPDIEAIIHSLHQAYSEPAAKRLARCKKAYDWAYQEYTAQHVLDTYWRPVLQEVFIEKAWRAQTMERF